MRNNLALLLLIAAPSVASATPLPLGVPTPQGQWRGPKLSDLGPRLRRLAAEPRAMIVQADPGFGTVRIAQGTSFSKPLGAEPGAVLAWISAEAAAFGLRDPARELRLLEPVVRDAVTGERYLRFERVHRGLPMPEAELTVLLDARGRVKRLTGHYPPSFDLPTTPRLDAERAATAARAFAGQGDRPDFVAPRQRLVVFGGGTAPRLAWEAVVAYGRSNREPYYAKHYVDATTGAVLAVRSLVWTAGVPEVCVGRDWRGMDVQLGCSRFPMNQDLRLLIDSAQLQNTEIATLNARHQTFNTNAEFVTGSSHVAADAMSRFSDVNAVSAHYGIGTSYRYFREVLNRPSWKQVGGMNLGQLSVVDYGQSYANAFAAPITIGNDEVSLSAFGNGDGQTLTETSGCLDVAGHEFTHNVVAATAGLVYQNQSGALNEHFADAFGTAIDKRYEDSDDLVGENCTPQGAGLRSMADPTARMQPAHNRDYRTLPNTDDGDHGGVHVNSGIPNKAFYAYYSATSVEVAEKVWYRALNAGGLTPNAQFLDFTSALRSACAALSLACGELDTALGSVGLYEAVSTPMGCPEHSTAMGMQCICDMGYQPSTDGASCQLIPTQSCPAHSSQVGEFCYCDAGYVTDAAGTGCVRETEAPCVAHAHRVGERCICDEGYYGDPNVPEGSCEQAEGSCPPLSVYDATAMGCACIAGFEPDMAGTSCVPSTQGCGEETPAGRCLEQLLVYCDDVTDPNAPQAAAIDCAAAGLSCATDMDGFVGCVSATDPCGDIPEAGRCAGDGLQFCAGEGAERGAYEINCAELNARCTLVEGGGADCVENGNPMNPDGGVGGDGGGDGGAGAEKSGCGCEAAGGEGGAPAGGGFLVLGLGLLLWRRSRPRGL